MKNEVLFQHSCISAPVFSPGVSVPGLFQSWRCQKSGLSLSDTRPTSRGTLLPKRQPSWQGRLTLRLPEPPPSCYRYGPEAASRRGSDAHLLVVANTQLAPTQPRRLGTDSVAGLCVSN